MTGLVALTLAALAAALLAGGRPNILKTRLTPASNTALPRSTRRWRRALSTRLRGRSLASRSEADIVDACIALGAELQAGAPVARALAAVAEDWPDLFEPAAVAAAVGADVATALRETATSPGAGSLRAVAAGWEVTDRTGAALSRIVMAVADALRTEAAVRREAHSQLATARATARLLAVLPFGTLLLLSGGDGAAMSFLFSTPVGLACLSGAVLFVVAGVWWVDRLARSATRSVWEA